MAKAGGEMVIYKAGSLKVGVDNGGPKEFKSLLFEILTDAV